METMAKAAIIAIVVAVPGVSVLIWNADPPPQVRLDDERINILVSFYPLYEFTKAVGGPKADVDILVRDGVEPHDWDPSIGDIEMIQNADLIVINGIGFESWVDKLDWMDNDTKIVDTSNGISILGQNDHDGAGHKDPHIWLNPVLAKTQVQNILHALQATDPDNASYYETNAEKYTAKLDALDKKIRDQLRSCRADFINYHDSFSYFAIEYGLRQHAMVSSGNSHMEPTPKGFQDIILLAEDLGIDVIFTQDGANQKTLDVIAQEINGRVMVLSSIEIGAPDLDYIGQMEANLSSLREALC